ncbi:hypothetical protein AMAG_08916 [Allomyces macrogynus ATCC 38327]|uniref:Altered inheritance of mitochondria protein 13, mitochondrial n=1 Tax=Allomyces macrogynus (strain ATCC 38327) TaxID=578462 RepID=A0A0L0SMZ1_ALLM3|nr:hypothetical protein AMAG_08916 [Allomyces macrogynus ATCC 38327]|eukprot:KNE63852.1 hypothetical protein AMAG_08916 [Allomyces macrogynus ATCC 38327]
MGQGQSKPAEPVVFVNTVPLMVSERLVHNLDAAESGAQSSEPTPAPVATSAPALSEEELHALVEERVAQRVAAELERRIATEGVRKDNREQLSSQVALREAEDMLQRLGRISLPTPEANPACLAAQEQVIACFKANPTRPLDCWQEVEAFKSSLKVVQKEFIHAASQL